MIVSVTELKRNLNKHLFISMTEDVFITRRGKMVGVLSNPFLNKIRLAESLFGSIPNGPSLQQTKEDRLSKKLKEK